MANELYYAWSNMVQGYQTKNDNLFEHGVIDWMGQNPENPFDPNSEESNWFLRIKNCYTVWRMGSADYRVNRRRMIDAARELCSLYPKRPYKFDRKADEAAKAEMAAQEEARQKAAEEKQAKEIEAEAERIIQKEKAEKEAAVRKERARLEWEAAEAKAKEEEAKYQADLKAAVEKKRADMVEENDKTVLLGVIPTEKKITDATLLHNDDVIDMKDLKSAEIDPSLLPREGFFTRMKRRFRGEKS